jgi:hypothetical protein
MNSSIGNDDLNLSIKGRSNTASAVQSPHNTSPSSSGYLNSVLTYLKAHKLLHADYSISNQANMSSRLKSKERVNPYSDNPIEVPSQFIYIEYPLDPAVDSLHTLSMRFGVSITDLKRINSLQNDRDVYALKTVKIPVKPNSIHTEKYAGQLKYSDQIVSRLATGALFNQDLDYQSNAGSNLDSNDDEDKSTGEDVVYMVDRARDGNLIAETEFIDDAPTTSLLLNDGLSSNINMYSDVLTQPRNSTTKQAREAKKYLKKFDNKLESLKNQNNELLNVMKNSEQLVPIQTCSYLVERQQFHADDKQRSGLFNLNVRDTLILACIVVVLAPLLFIVYRYIWITEHTGNSLKP